MIVANRSPSAGLALPELEVPPEHIAIRHSTPPDLKGLKYTHLPGLGSDGRSTIPANEEPVVLLPVLDEPHPFPYIISPSITLTGESLEIEQMQDNDDDKDDDDDDNTEMASHYFLMETQFSKEFLEDFLEDLLHREFVETLEAVLGMETEEKTEPEMEPKEQAALLENNETDEKGVEIEQKEEVEVQNFEDEDFEIYMSYFMELEVDYESRYVAWEHIESLLAEWELTNISNQNDAQRLSPKLQQALSLCMAGQIPVQDEARELNVITIDKILFEYHHMLHEQKLENNEALRHFQNDLIGHSLTSLILRDGLHHLVNDIDSLKNEEIKLYPPRV